MLIQFRYKNFKSFKDDTILDFSATKITEHSDRVVQIGNEKILPTAAIFGANAIRDFMAQLRDFFGGRSASYEEVLLKGKEEALRELEERAASLGANAVVGVTLSYEAVGDSASMLMVVATGTAVVI